MSPPTLPRLARLSLVPGICIALALMTGAYANKDKQANNTSVAPQTAHTGEQLSVALGSRLGGPRADGNGSPISSVGGYSSDFEAPLYAGSAGGRILTGQDEFYIPVPDSQDGLVYTYVGNALGLPTNPTGGDQFAGVTGTDDLPVPFARAQRDIVYGDGTGVWTVSFDIAATYIGVLPSAQNIGSFSTQVFPGEATFIALVMWTDPDTATNWDANYVWFDAQGGQVTEPVADPAFQGLDDDHWYRWSTTFNLDTNQILQVSITDLTTGVTSTHSPSGRYLEGGEAGGAPTPTGFRLFGGAQGTAGNTLGFDNISIDLAGGSPLGACCLQDDSCVVLTESDCTAAGGIYDGDGTGCAPLTCVKIPPTCGKGAGPCGVPNGSPGCEDVECCVLVCDPVKGDPFCCKVEWDQQCADAAIDLGCAVIPYECANPGPVNDCCTDPMIVNSGDLIPFDTTDANTDGLLDPSNPCNSANDDAQIWKDLWYLFDAPASGILTASVCFDPTNFDTKIAAYDVGTPDYDCNEIVDLIIACNEDCEGPPYRSELQFAVTGGNTYLIRLGSFSPTANEGGAEFGPGEISFEFEIPDPPTGFEFFFDEAAFEAAVAAAGKVVKGTEDFSENLLADNTIFAMDDPLDTNSSNAAFPDGILIDNLTFQANTGGADSTVPAPHTPNNPDEQGLVLVTTGGAGATADTVLANFFVDGYDILSGPPAGDSHTALGLTLVSILGTGTVNVAVYDQDNISLGSVAFVPAPVDGGGFFGILAIDGNTIGRVNIFDGGGGAEGVYDVTAYVADGVPCPWDLDGNNDVGIGDLLIILADWGNPYGIGDLLALLAAWGPCP